MNPVQLRRRGLLLASAALLVTASGTAQAGSYDDFFTAVRKDDSRTIEALLRRGFDPNTKDPKGLSGLLIAVRESSPKVIKTLLSAPTIQVETRNAQDESPLMLAALQGQLALAKALIDKDADVNKPGWAPLHYAATKGDVPMIALLLDNDAYIDAESPNRSTPLMMAAMYGSTDAVKTLLEAGADPLLKNEQGLTAFDFAFKANRAEVADAIAATIRAKQPKGKW